LEFQFFLFTLAFFIKIGVVLLLNYNGSESSILSSEVLFRLFVKRYCEEIFPIIATNKKIDCIIDHKNSMGVSTNSINNNIILAGIMGRAGVSVCFEKKKSSKSL
jgi:hypothetical protein